ncbi:hypothetical protein [Flavobacterium sp. N3904]|uniref:hypothetical protein n=1 Tax=Flavobacterium sp. N3904 TaxID=2986835 RepID=UPI0022252C5E|nr:hypothetical protein [Flavobacterium sp. N3904]
MKNFKIIFSSLFLATVISCGKNEPEEKVRKETNASQTTNLGSDSLTNETQIINESVKKNQPKDSYITSNPSPSTTKNTEKNHLVTKDKETVNPTTTATKNEEIAEAIINTPLRNLLNNAQLGKSYTKKELIEHYKFPKEAVDLIKSVTYVGENKLYFKWGSTWLAEKVSDAKFKNDTLVFAFKKNKTYVSGGAIGIKYNKKIYTDLILNNGAAYIPSVKGYHWDINK